MQLSFDQLLTSRIQFGKSQYQTFAVLSLIDFLDGAEFVYLQLLNAILYKEWSLTITQLIILGSIFNFGQFLGSLICGLYSDRLGRKVVLVFGCFMQFFAVFLTALVIDFLQLVSLRFLFGFLYGMILPLSQILIAEITPLKNRGQFIVALQITYILGRMWTLLLASFFLVSLTEGNWRGMALCNAIPCFLCLIGSIYYIRESPRFLIGCGRIEEGVAGLNEMGILNNSNYEQLNQEEIQQLSNWQLENFTISFQQRSFSKLFQGENLPITWRAYALVILAMLLYSGIYMIIPFLLAEQDKTILDLFYTILVEIPAVIIVFLYIDELGRLPIVIFGAICSTISVFIIWLYREQYMILGMISFKFFNRINFLAFIPLIVESYTTIYRSLGIGTTLALGRFSGFFSPAIVFPLYAYDQFSPFLFGTFTLMIMSLIFIYYPKDMARQPLDQLEQSKYLKQN